MSPWLLLPGLVNAHAHLQLSALPRPAGPDFVAWLQAVISRRGQVGPLAAQARTERALDELLRSGCTAVGEIDSLGTSPALLHAIGMAGRCYQEVLGFDLDARAAANLVRVRARRGTVACAAGLSPHAPYSCSSALLRASRRATSHITVHVAEVEAELQLLRRGSGPMRRLLQRLGKWPRAGVPRHGSSVEWLAGSGALDRRTLLVHLQVSSASDLDLVRRRRSPVVVCPATIEFFRRQPPDVPGWLRAGIVVALGTDSRASSRGPLSMVTAMALARRMWPGLPPASVLAMATRWAACAIGRPGLGRIAQGGRADLCAFRLPHRASWSDAVDAATAGDLPVHGTWLCGRRVHGSEQT